VWPGEAILKRHRSPVLSALVAITAVTVSLAVAGCETSPRYSAGQTVPLRGGATVRLVAATETTGGVRLAFDLDNASDSAIDIPSRPLRPIVTLTDGTPALNVSSRESSGTGVHGGFGPAAAGNPPYLEPGGVVHFVWVIEMPAGAMRDATLTVSYSPLMETPVDFVVSPVKPAH
jgi:hypothetical protein